MAAIAACHATAPTAPATHANLLRRLGRSDQAAAYRRALELAPTDAERRYLTRRLAETSATR
jgi:RNA polymerase sigma-70 factor (ECF subfamily)